MSQDDAPKITTYNPDYNIKQCIKCGRRNGASVVYNAPTDRLLVSCKECGYTYYMRPKNWKGGDDE